LDLLELLDYLVSLVNLAHQDRLVLPVHLEMLVSFLPIWCETTELELLELRDNLVFQELLDCQEKEERTAIVDRKAPLGCLAHLELKGPPADKDL